MKEKFIPNTEKKYSITSDGIVYSNYKNTNNGGKFYEKKPVTKYIQQGFAVINLQFGKWSKTNKSKIVFMNTLMKDIFKLKKPDMFHMYSLTSKNDNVLDCSLDNLEWKIRTNSDFNFYPQPYYDKKGNITSKRCSCCGEIKNIICYNMQSSRRKVENITYRNKCTNCRTKERKIIIDSDSYKLAKYKEQQKKYINSEKGKNYHKKYNVALYKKNYDNISDHYISNCLKITQKELTQELREIFKKKTTLKRKLENHGKEN